MRVEFGSMVVLIRLGLDKSGKDPGCKAGSVTSSSSSSSSSSGSGSGSRSSSSSSSSNNSRSSKGSSSSSSITNVGVCFMRAI